MEPVPGFFSAPHIWEGKTTRGCQQVVAVEPRPVHDLPTRVEEKGPFHDDKEVGWWLAGCARPRPQRAGRPRAVAPGTTFSPIRKTCPRNGGGCCSGDVHRFPSRHHYASYCGTAPIEAFSGDLRRHRLSRAGNRQLNSAMHVIAVCQARDPGPGRDHYRRKLAEAKAPAEARRGLKRQLSNVVYKHLVADQRAAIASTTDLQRALPGIPMINHPRSGVDVLTLHGQVPGERRRQKPGTAAPLTTTAFGTKHWRVTL